MAYVEKRGTTWRVRYLRPDGTYASESGFATKTAAAQFGSDEEADIRRGRWRDPRREQVTFDEWVQIWWIYQGHLAPETRANYKHRLKVVTAEFGSWLLPEIKWLPVKAWAATLRPTVRSEYVSCLSTLLSAAVDDERLDSNPLYRRRLGRAHKPDKAWVTAVGLYEIVNRCARPCDALMVETAFWTGMRYGEVMGLRRDDCGLLRGDPKRRVIRIDPDEGSLHEVAGKRWLGPPKPPNGAREIDLPAFLADKLAAHLADWPYEHVFTTQTGKWWWRTRHGEFMKEITAGTGLTFHGLRHSHKVLLDELGCPDVLRCERMGHTMKGIAGVYSHVSPAMRSKLLADMQDRFSQNPPMRAGERR